MNILLVAGIWLAIAALASLLIGAGASVGSRRPTRPLSALRAARAPRVAAAGDYVAISFDDWAAAAHADATRALLDTRPVAVRRVFDAFPEHDG